MERHYQQEFLVPLSLILARDAKKLITGHLFSVSFLLFLLDSFLPTDVRAAFAASDVSWDRVPGVNEPSSLCALDRWENFPDWWHGFSVFSCNISSGERRTPPLRRLRVSFPVVFRPPLWQASRSLELYTPRPECAINAPINPAFSFESHWRRTPAIVE